jgi:tetrapyrrole methylase family protein/MazG family protein
MGKIEVIGLGPGDPSLLTAAARGLLTAGRRVILRTRHHPTVAMLDAAHAFEDCDDLYRAGVSFDEVYRAIAMRVLTAAADGDVVYAVPGHPLIAEQSVVLLLDAAAARGIAVQVHPAVSYVDVAAVALHRDLGDVQLCDALDLRIDAQKPALISQVYDRDGAADLKLRLLDIYPPEHTVTLLHALGGPEERAAEMPLAELDHRPFGYLDCLFVPALDAIDDVRRFDGLYAVIERLHAPDGCPWDREQTHASLRPHLLEEAYEALEAIDAADPVALTEELGDVLLQVLMHAAVGKREGTFDYGDVNAFITQKLIRRHPHVFGEATAADAEEVYQNWEALKQQEKPRTSILDGVPRSLPALAASQSIQGRARRIGFDWPDIEGPLEKLREEIDEFAHAEGAADREDEFGDVLFVIANIAQRLGIEAEQALRHANEKFRRRFGQVEAFAAAENVDLHDLDLAGLDALWDRAKATERVAGPAAR